MLTAGLAVFVLGGCAAPGDPKSGAEARRLRVGYPGPQGFGELPSYIANQELEGAGYTIETTFYVQPELAVQALTQRTIDLSVGSTRIHWVAAARGAPVLAVIEGVRNNHLLVVASSVDSCRQLDKRRVGLTGPAAMGATLFRDYMRTACPGVEPEVLFIAGSPNRAAALVTATIDASVMFRAEAVDLFGSVPGRFRSLPDFDARSVDLITSAMFVNRTFAAEQATAVGDYVRAHLRALRVLNGNAAVAALQAERLMGVQRDYRPIADAYEAAGAWDEVGGLSVARVRATEGFLVAAGELDQPLSESVMVDRSFLERARAEPGASERPAPR